MGQEQGKSGLNPALHSRHFDRRSPIRSPHDGTAHPKTGLQCVAEPPKSAVFQPELVWIRPTATSRSVAQACSQSRSSHLRPAQAVAHSNSAPTHRTVQQTRRSFSKSTPISCGSSAPRPRPVSDWWASPCSRPVVVFNFATDIRALNSTPIKPAVRRPARAVVLPPAFFFVSCPKKRVHKRNVDF
jgi:hypothetical protein